MPGCADLQQNGVRDGPVRISVGVEGIEYIKADIKHALPKATTVDNTAVAVTPLKKSAQSPVLDEDRECAVEGVPHSPIKLALRFSRKAWAPSF